MNFKRVFTVIIFIVYAIQPSTETGQSNYPSPSNQDDLDSSLRFKRNPPDPLSVTVARAQKVSRIVNGIALQQGLSKGTISPNILISELLNFESITPSEIKGIKADVLAGIVQEIQDLPGQLTPDDQQKAGIEKNEKRFLMYGSMLKKTNGIGADFEIPKKAEYMAALRKYLSDFGDVNILVDALKRFQIALTSFTEMSTVQNSNDIQIQKKLKSLTEDANDIKNIDTFKYLVDDPHLKDAEGTFKALINVHSAVQEFQDSELFNSYSSKEVPFVGKIGENIKTLNDLAEKSKSSLSNFQSLIQIFVSRHHHNGNKIQTLISGFKSPAELNLIFQDLEDPWINTAVNNTAESLSLALTPLKTLKSKTEALENSLVLPDGDDLKVLEISEVVGQLSEYADKFALIHTNLDKAKLEATQSEMEPTNQEKVGELLRKMLSLSKKLTAIETIVDISAKLTDGGEHFQKVQDMLAIIKDPDVSTAPQQLDDLQKSSQFQKVLEVLKSAESSMEALSSGTPPHIDLKQVKTLADEVSKAIGEIDTYMNGLTGFFEKMDGLRQVEGIDMVEEAVDAIRMYRDLKPNDLKFDSITSQLTTVNTVLDSLQKIIEGFKDTKNPSPESKMLVELKDVLPKSQIVGSATNVLSSIDSLAKNKIVMDHNSIDLIKKELGNIKDPEDKKNLEILTEELNGELDKLYQGIGAIKVSATSSDLASLHPTFLEAKKISGLSYDFRKIQKSLRKVPNVPQSELDKILQNLETLDTLGLDFAKRHAAIDGSKKSLEDLDLFFASFYQKMNAPVATPPLGSSPGPGTALSGKSRRSNAASGALGGEKATTPKTDNTMLIVIIVIVVLVFLVAAGIGICCWKKHQKGPDPYPDHSSSTDLEDGKNKKDVKKNGAPSTTPAPPPLPPTPEQPPVIPLPTQDAVPAPPPPPVPEGPKEPPPLELAKTQKSYRIKLVHIDEKILSQFVRSFSDILTNAKKYDDELEGISFGAAAVKYLRNKFKIYDTSTKTVTSHFVKTMEKWQRHNVPLAEKNRVKLKIQGSFGTDYIHANMFTYQSGLRIIFMQGPQARSEDPQDPKESNIEIFFAMLIEQGSEFIVQLTKFVEDENVQVDEYIPLEKGQSVRFEGLRVTCTELVKTFDDQLETRDLLVEFDGKPAHTVQHLLYNSWPYDGVPQRTAVAIGILHKIRENPYPVVVHGSAGIGRTGTFGIIELIYQTIALEKTLHYGTVLQKFRQTRANAVQNEFQYAFGFRCALDYLAANVDVTKQRRLNNLRSEMEAAIKADEEATRIAEEEASRNTAIQTRRMVEEERKSEEARKLAEETNPKTEPTQPSYKENAGMPGTSNKAVPTPVEKKSKHTKGNQKKGKKKKSKEPN